MSNKKPDSQRSSLSPTQVQVNLDQTSMTVTKYFSNNNKHVYVTVSRSALSIGPGGRGPGLGTLILEAAGA